MEIPHTPPEVREHARRLLAKSKKTVDVDRLVGMMVGALTDDQKGELLRLYCREIIGEEIRRARNAEPSVKPGPSKWKIPSFVSLGVNTWKLEDECTAEELLLVADNYARQISALQERERYYRQLAAELLASGCRTVGEMRKGMAA